MNILEKIGALETTCCGHRSLTLRSIRLCAAASCAASSYAAWLQDLSTKPATLSEFPYVADQTALVIQVLINTIDNKKNMS